jgi:predicted transcriptional regulator
MTDKNLFPAKATNAAEQSNAVVVSFAAEWHQHLLARDFSVVIRKRVPRSKAFKWLYFHINTPVCAICGRAPIENITDLTEEHAVALASAINLSPLKIKTYIGGERYVGSYSLGTFQLGCRPVHSKELGTRMIYHPPQSFFILSKRGKEMVDEMVGLGQHAVPQLRKAQKL